MFFFYADTQHLQCSSVLVYNQLQQQYKTQLNEDPSPKGSESVRTYLVPEPMESQSWDLLLDDGSHINESDKPISNPCTCYRLRPSLVWQRYLHAKGLSHKPKRAVPSNVDLY